MPWWYIALMFLGYMFLMDCVRRIARRLESRIPLAWRPLLCGPTTKENAYLWVIIIVGFYAVFWLITVHMGLN